MAGDNKYVDTPLMKQYYAIKAKHPDAVLLFRIGDFYETFGDDAIKAADILGITLTRRANGAASYVELAGFPYHALDTYLPKLVRAGQRVAICEQLEDPKLAKKIVKRGITEMVTPGVSINDNVLNNRENNFLASVHFDRKMAGVAFLDISTGEFMTAQGTYEYIDKLLSSFQPKEVLYQRGRAQEFNEFLERNISLSTLMTGFIPRMRLLTGSHAIFRSNRSKGSASRAFPWGSSPQVPSSATWNLLSTNRFPTSPASAGSRRSIMCGSTGLPSGIWNSSTPFTKGPDRCSR